jgi:aryl-alcohol dehydrogenase-like predicted oxidoreductase
MTFGTSWGFGIDETESRGIIDMYLNAGGNFIDTANVYTGGESEQILGAVLGERRTDVVLASKYSLLARSGDANSLGNHRRNLVRSVEESLMRLDTDWIDLLWVHAWYFENEVEETVLALDQLAASGKILYWGFSDTPAWVCAEARAYARVRGWTPLSATQIEYSLIERTAERELLPFSVQHGLGIAGAIPLGGSTLSGKHRGHAEEPTDSARRERVEARRSERIDAIVDTVVQCATELNVAPATLAIAWILARTPQVVPILGVRTARQLEQNLAAASLSVPAATLQQLDEVSKISAGFPHEMLASDRMQEVMYGPYRA